MTLYAGSGRAVTNVFVGTRQATAFYLGSKKIWPAGLPAPIKAAPFVAHGPFTYTIPDGALHIDYVLLGGGGAGGVGGGGNNAGGGGQAGQWLSGTVTIGVDIPTTTKTITGVIGTGAPSATNNNLPLSHANDTIVRATGWAGLTAKGGISGYYYTHSANPYPGVAGGLPEGPGLPTRPGARETGGSVKPLVFKGTTYTGGAGGTTGLVGGKAKPGGNPGGGGAGSPGVFLGTGAPSGKGGDGAIWLIAY
jgi:hypothetical protein